MIKFAFEDLLQTAKIYLIKIYTRNAVDKHAIMRLICCNSLLLQLMDVGLPHIIGGVMLFALGLVYIALQCMLTLFLKTKNQSTLLVRILLLFICTSSFVYRILFSIVYRRTGSKSIILKNFTLHGHTPSIQLYIFVF